MKITTNRILFTVAVAIVTLAYSNECKQTRQSGLQDVDNKCPSPWHIYDSDTHNCECYNNSHTEGIVRCTDTYTEVQFGFCMTMEDDGTYVGHCRNDIPSVHYPHMNNLGDKKYIVLPRSRNRSLINDYMCGRLNSTGIICSQCIEGYGPTVVQVAFECAKCEWYGIPVYLLLQFGPLTLVFIILLLFPISVTSAPMICFVMYCQLVATILMYNQILAGVLQSQSALVNTLFHIIGTLSNIWSLNFTTFLTFIPPICVHSNLKNIHVIMLKYVAAMYPLLLIIITYTCVQLHTRGNKVIVFLWKPFHRWAVRSKRAWDPKKSVIDVFSSFLLLSYSKLLQLSFMTIANTYIDNMPVNTSVSIPRYHVLSFDPTVTFLGKEHMPLLLFATLIFVLFIILPVLLLCFYPMTWFQKCLNRFKPTRNCLSLRLFVEKFQQDYCDGLNGQRYDLRSFSSMYMVILAVAYATNFLSYTTYFGWFSLTLWMIISMLSVLTIRPHRKNYMNVISSLIIATFVFQSLLFNSLLYDLLSSEIVTVMWIILVLYGIPQMVFISYLVYKPLQKCGCFKKMRGTCCKHSRNELILTENTPLLEQEFEPDRLRNPDDYQAVNSLQKYNEGESEPDTY